VTSGGGAPAVAAFGRLLGAAVVANLGDGIFWVALPLLAVGLTDSPALVAGVTVASRLPWLVFALVAGALVDRVDRRRAMVGVDLVRVVLVGALAVAVAADAASIWLLYAVAFALGMLETVHDTAVQAVVPVVVPERERLASANGRLYGLELIANQFVGPPVGGFLVATAMAAAFGATAAGYLGAALLLATLPGTFRAARTGPATSVVTDIREGIRYLAGHRELRTLALLIGVLNLAGGAMVAVLVLYAVAPGPLGLDPVGYGLLLAVMAVGTVTGTLGAGVIERRVGKANIVTLMIATFALQNLVLATSTQPLVVAPVLALAGVAAGAFQPVFVAWRQRIVPDRLLGRVVATWLGLQAVFLGATALIVAMLPVRLVLTERTLLAAEAAAQATGPGARP
jgi:MFS family permease